MNEKKVHKINIYGVFPLDRVQEYMIMMTGFMNIAVAMRAE